MNYNRKLKFFIVCLIPVLILVSMTIQPLLTYFYGSEILLETEPYDPRDIFRGDYVVLNYKISNIGIDKFDAELRTTITQPDAYNKFQNKILYVVLKRENDFYDVDYVTLERPQNQLFLKAQFRYYQMAIKGEIESIHIDYNLDKFFVPENTGERLEELSRQGQLAAKVRVFKGYSLLIDVFPKEITKT